MSLTAGEYVNEETIEADDAISENDSLPDPFTPTDDSRDPDYTLKQEKTIKRKKLTDFFGLNNSKSKKKSDVYQSEASQSYDETSSTIFSEECEDEVTILDKKTQLQQSADSALLDGTFFAIISCGVNSTVSAQCQKCPGKKIIRGRSTCTSNFLRHLKNKHPTAYADYVKYKSQKKLVYKSRVKSKKTEDTKSVSKTQTDIRSSFTHSKNISQEQFDRRIIQFVIHSMSAISVINNPYFVQLFDGMKLNVMSRGKAMKQIELLKKNMVVEIKTALTDTQFVCSTADIWSSKKRSFMGVTAHWINTNSLERKSVALACRRFSGTHSFDKIAEMLEEIYNEFGLDNVKIMATVTDNGSNFVKAFKEYGINLEINVLLNSIPTIQVDDDGEENYSENQDTGELDEIVFQPDSVEKNEYEEHVSTIHLPNHYRCTAHTLNLIATTDIMNAINKNLSLRSKHTNIMNKCTQLWNKSARPKSAEVIKEILGNHLSYPGVTRWNSFYDSLTQILKQKEKLNNLYENLGIRNYSLKENEIEYLEEYVIILKPLALAIDILQGDKQTYFGTVMPTIGSLHMKYEKLKSLNLRYLNFLIDVCIKSIESRFSLYFKNSIQSEIATIAATLIPKFKLRWLHCFKNTPFLLQECDVKKMIINAAKDFIRADNLPKIKNYQSEVDDFFELSAVSENDYNEPENVALNEFELQFLQYLQDPSDDIQSLQRYNFLKSMFLKYNSILPSSAPVERLFSYATFINSPRRHALTDNNFENLVLLKANNV